MALVLKWCDSNRPLRFQRKPMKLKKLHIEDYKMFKDFDISFVDENDEALPIVVLAGVNGSGKTTLLEVLFLNKISNRLIELEDVDNQCNFTLKAEKITEDLNKEYKAIYRDEIIYFPSGIDKVSKVENEFVKSFYFFLKEKDYRPSEVKNHFDEYMQEVFNGLDLTFKYSHLDRDDNVWFSNANGEEFEINDLSTGEKTLLSKVLYLYFLGYKEKIILIDEPELSLHPSWQNKVLKIYENFAIQNNCQIIIATHSPHIIASAKNKYLRFLIKEENEIVVKQLDNSPLSRDTNTILKTIMGANYIPKELEELHLKYRVLFDEKNLETKEAKELEKKILEFESPNSSFFQGIAFDKALME
jgi:predicted ATP-binding protein involved in virulence